MSRSDDIAQGILKAEAVRGAVGLFNMAVCFLFKLIWKSIVFMIKLPGKITHAIQWKKIEANAAKNRKAKEDLKLQATQVKAAACTERLEALREGNRRRELAAKKAGEKDPEKARRWVKAAFEQLSLDSDSLLVAQPVKTEIAPDVFLLSTKVIVDLNVPYCLNYEDPLQKEDFEKKLEEYAVKLLEDDTLQLPSGETRVWR